LFRNNLALGTAPGRAQADPLPRAARDEPILPAPAGAAPP